MNSLHVAAGQANDEWVRPSAGIDFTLIDHSIRPGDDFYRYANGHWLNTNVIPDGIPRFNTYSAMQQDLAQAIRFVIVSAAEDPNLQTGSVGRTVGDFFNSGMDTNKIEAEGLTGLQLEWNMINSIETNDDLARAVAQLQMSGVSVFFDIHDPRHWELKGNHELFLRQGGLGLPEPSNYWPDEGDRSSLRDRYRHHLTTIFTLAGHDSSSAAKDADAALAFESALARLWESESANPSQHDTRISISKLKRSMPSFEWGIYLEELKIPGEKHIIVRQPNYFRDLGRMMKSTEAADWRPNLRACLLHRAAVYLGKDFVTEYDRFHMGEVRNRHRRIPRDQRVAREVERALPWAVGELYMRRFFAESTESAAQDMIEQLRAALTRITQESKQFGAEQRIWQLEKLAAMEFRIGGPRDEVDLSGLTLDRSSYIRNAFAAHR